MKDDALHGVQNVFIEASAGSGKTYQLTSRFIALLVLGVDSQKIIALTFTRKAAGEFVEEILLRLSRAASSVSEADELSAELKILLKGSREQKGIVSGETFAKLSFSQQKYQFLLGRLVHEMSRLSLGTLDGFFAKIISHFSMDLGMVGFQVMDDFEHRESQEDLLADIFVAGESLSAFTSAFKMATIGEEENRVHQKIEQYLSEWHGRFLMAPSPSRWGDEVAILEKDDFLSTLPESLSFPQEAMILKEGLAGVSTGSGKLRKNWDQPWLKLITFFENYQPGSGQTPPPLLEALLAQLGTIREKEFSWDYYRNEYQFPAPFQEALWRIVGSYVRGEIQNRAQQTKGVWALLALYEKQYHEKIRQQGRLVHSDLTRLLTESSEHWRRQMAYRMDVSHEHWMLDEFQDTSRGQWKALESSIDEAVFDPEEVRSLFVVGDQKQSIYGWRGGEPRLFGELKERYSESLSVVPMNRSYRSSQAILDLVNATCSHEALAQLTLPKGVLSHWNFGEHDAAKKQAGRARVLQLNGSGPEEEAQRLNLLDHLLKEEAPLERGLTCAVIVRTNPQVSKVTQALREFGYRVSPVVNEKVVEDFPAGEVLLEIIKWMLTPADQFAYQRCMQSPLSAWLASKGSERSEQWEALREARVEQGWAGVLREVMMVFRLLKESSHFVHERFDYLEVLLSDFEEKGEASGEKLLRMLEGVTRKQVGGKGEIQVMSIHQSKGLGFDLVVLPYLSKEAFDTLSHFETLEWKDAQGEVLQTMLKTKKEVLEALPSTREPLAKWKEAQCIEGLCRYYVALTRAKHSLWVMVPEKVSERLSEASLAHLVASPEGSAKEDFFGAPILGEWKEGVWPEPFEREKPAEEEQDEGSLKLPPPVMIRRQALLPSRHEKPQLDPEQAAGRRYGQSLHEELAQVECLNEDELLLLSPTLRKLISAKEIWPYFDRQQFSSGEKVLREVSFDLEMEGEWVSGVIDRIHLRKGSCEIIEYKTDRVSEMGELVASYEKQTRLYAAAASVLTGCAPEKVSRVVLSTHLQQAYRFPESH